MKKRSGQVWHSTPWSSCFLLLEQRGSGSWLAVDLQTAEFRNIMVHEWYDLL